MSLASRISAAMADNWMKQKEAVDIVIEAQRGNVSASELSAVEKLNQDIVAKGTQIAPGTQTILDNFVERHDRKLDLEQSPTSDLAPIFDKIDFWFGTKEAGISWLKSLPSAVERGFDAKLEADGMTREDWDWESTEMFKLPIGGQYAYGYFQDDGGHSGGFSIAIFSPKGRLLWDISGQND